MRDVISLLASGDNFCLPLAVAVSPRESKIGIR
jgi:hypothetical protein